MPLSKARRDELRKQLEELPKEKVIAELSKFDAKETLPLIMDVLGDAERQNNNNLSAYYEILTGKEMKAALGYDTAILSDKIIGDTKKFFEKKRDSIKLDELTDGKIKEIYDEVIKAVIQKIIPASVTNDAQKKVELQQFVDCLRVHVFLKYAIQVYAISDELQSANMIKQGIMITSLDDVKITKSYKMIALAVKQMTVTRNTQVFFDYWESCLRGLYLRTYNDIKAQHKDGIGQVIKENGVYPRVDPEDESFYKYLNLTKYDMALLHKEAADALVALLNKFADWLKQNPVDEGVESKKIPGFTQVVITVSDASLKANPELVRQLISIARSKIKVQRQVVSANIMTKELSPYQNKTANDKLDQLWQCLEKYELTLDQMDSLKFIAQRVSDELTPVITKKRGQWRLKVNYFSPVSSHIDAAETLINDISASQDVREQLIKLFEFRRSLRNELSKDFLPAVEAILLSVFDKLMLGPVFVEVNQPRASVVSGK